MCQRSLEMGAGLKDSEEARVAVCRHAHPSVMGQKSHAAVAMLVRACHAGLLSI